MNNITPEYLRALAGALAGRDLFATIAATFELTATAIEELNEEGLALMDRINAIDEVVAGEQARIVALLQKEADGYRRQWEDSGPTLSARGKANAIDWARRLEEIIAAISTGGESVVNLCAMCEQYGAVDEACGARCPDCGVGLGHHDQTRGCVPARRRSEIEILRIKLAIAAQALEFYATHTSWHEVHEQDSTRDHAAIDGSDEEGFTPTYDAVGGKRARSALMMIREIT